MKNNFLLVSSVIAAMAAGATHALAVPTSFSETINNINFGIHGATYDGTFIDANLKNGSSVFNNTQETITSASVELNIQNGSGFPISLTIDGVTLDLTPSSNSQTLTYNLTPTQYDFIQAQDGTFNYFVTVDCTLSWAELTVNTSPLPPTPSVPDSGSTVTLLGGSLALLGWAKRKIAKA